MGAQHTHNFLSAEKLGISQAERAGLIAVMDHLQKSEVVHVEHAPPSGEALTSTTSGPVGFSMAVTVGTDAVTRGYDCGCAACIGGHLSLYMQGIPLLTQPNIELTVDQAAVADNYTLDQTGELYKLFFPPSEEIHLEWKHIKPATAATAICNYLTTGESHWRDAALKNDQPELVPGWEA